MARLRVREVAIEKGIDAVELARRSRISYTSISNMFKDPEYNATLETLEALAKALGVKVTDLIDDDEKK